ncbi:hypothetical protein JKF63_03694 [Porcisia hertigi]|uniref:MsrB domain-containing protein n=1 Tax=Porcisia hertigi TaxID=2761500 RepID=A0A836L6Y0_9TRYP|nr:hypothetical protein JKF63_03694 [Porcisia hertigi]
MATLRWYGHPRITLLNGTLSSVLLKACGCVDGIVAAALHPRRSFHGSMSAPVTNCAGPLEKDGSKDVGDAEWRRLLTPQEYHILREKGTDPVGGTYDNVFDDGEYVCAACKTPLYHSSMKFACGCGWPGFYDCIPKRVREQPDQDGRRVEIVCNACNSHLGHIFRNEGFRNPPPNERHCVNSTSIILRTTS